MPIPQQGKYGLFGLLSDEVKRQLILTGFAANYDTARQSGWESYLAHYHRELGRVHSGISYIQTATIGLAAKSHEDIIYIIQLLLEQRQTKKRDLKEKLSIRFPGADAFAIDRSVDLVVRLWLMLNVRSIDEPVRTPHKVAIHWDNDLSLLDLINAQFQTPSSVVDSKRSRMHPSFTIATMVTVCGLKLRWTDSLEDHLRLDPRKKEIWIFPGKDLLMKHVIASKERQSDILPVALLRETITTLNLLFPQWDPQTQALLSTHGQDFHTLPPFEGPRRLDLSEFKYWRSHLLELYEEIYLAPADSWRQLWTDRRNPHQWWTFWIAVVVLALSIVSCITSVIQAWASIEALKSR